VLGVLLLIACVVVSAVLALGQSIRRFRGGAVPSDVRAGAPGVPEPAISIRVEARKVAGPTWKMRLALAENIVRAFSLNPNALGMYSDARINQWRLVVRGPNNELISTVWTRDFVALESLERDLQQHAGSADRWEQIVQLLSRADVSSCQ